MQNKRVSFFGVFIAVALVMSTVVQVFQFREVSAAAQITSRSLTLLAGDANNGGSKPSGVVKHKFDFTLPTDGLLGSIKFEYCTTAADTGTATCTMPDGLNTDGAGVTLEAESGAQGFTLVKTTNGAPYLTRTAAVIDGPLPVSYTLAGVTNPSAANKSFFVRISTYVSEDTTGTAVDAGVVVASTANPIVLNGIMPESLVFCTGKTVGTTSNVPDCTTAENSTVNFNKLFSATETATATSQMAASTNAGFGYVITVNGATLTSGSNTINPMGTLANPDTASIKGVSQFGMNLKANTALTSNPVVGTEVAPAANGTNYRGQAKAGYDIVDAFKFETGNVVAASDYTAEGGTDAQIFTASYIVNVPGSQPAGTYSTTLTYICTPRF